MAVNETPELSVVIPAFRAAGSIAETVRALAGTFAAEGIAAEILVVDDGSDDGTAAAAERAGAALAGGVRLRVLRSETNRGKGAAVRRGLAAAHGRYRLFVDADLQYPPQQVLRVLGALREGADLAVASRAEPRSRIELEPAALIPAAMRHAAGRLLAAVVRAVLSPPVRDTQAGLKGMTAGTAQELLPRLSEDRFGFDVELLVAASRAGMRVVEIPVVVRASPTRSSVDFLLDGLDLLAAVARVALRQALGRYGRGSGGAVARPRRPGRVPPRLGGAAAVTVPVALAGCVALRGARPWLAFGLWLVAGAAVLAAAAAVDGDDRGWRRPATRRRGEGLVLVVLFALAAALRLLALDRVPPMIHGDSAECGLRGLELLHGRADPLGVSDWYWTPYPSFLPYAAAFGSLGVSVASLRLPSAVTGTLAVLPLYWLARRWFGFATAVAAAALYAVFHPAVHFSRIGLWNIQVVLLAVTAMAAAEGAVARRSAFLGAVSGLACGASLYTYTAGRLVPGMVAVLFAAHGLRGGLRARGGGRLAVAWLVAFGAAIVPMAWNVATIPELLHDDRSYSVSVLAEINRRHVVTTLGKTTVPGILAEQVRRTLAGFVSLGDQSTQYGTPQPLFSVVGAVVFGAGLLAAARRFRQPGAATLLLWVVSGLLLGSVAVIDPPSYTRLVVLFGAFCILFGHGAAGIARRAGRLAGGRAAGALAVTVLAALVAGEGWWSLRGYGRFVEAMRLEAREWDVVRAREKAGPAEDYYLFTGPFMMADAPFFRLFFGGVRAITGFSELDLPARLRADTVFVVMPNYERVSLEIERRFPGIERQTLARDGRPQVLVYRCAADNGCRS